MGSQNIIVSEITQTQEDKQCMFSLIGVFWLQIITCDFIPWGNCRSNESEIAEVEVGGEERGVAGHKGSNGGNERNGVFN